MQTTITRWLAAGTLALGMLNAHAQVNEFTTYVGQCKTSLGFADSNIPATVDCYDGVLFEEHSPIRDFVPVLVERMARTSLSRTATR